MYGRTDRRGMDIGTATATATANGFVGEIFLSP